MDNSLTMRLFNFIRERSHLKEQDEMESAYNEFTKLIKTIADERENHIEIIRILNYTRIELVSLDTFSRNEQEKKCTKKICCKGGFIVFSNITVKVDTFTMRNEQSQFIEKVISINNHYLAEVDKKNKIHRPLYYLILFLLIVIFILIGVIFLINK